jgi:hypothetical protein
MRSAPTLKLCRVAYPILSVVTMGIDIGKNSFHVVGLARK